MRRRAPEFDETAIGRFVIAFVGVLAIAGIWQLLFWAVTTLVRSFEGR